MEVRRYHIQNYIVKEDQSKFLAMLDNAKKDRINGAKGLFRIYKPDESIFWMQLLVYYLRDEGGQEVFYGSAMDMTEVMNLREQSKR